MSTAVPDLSQLPEQIGYLHQLGLTWWYGPTSMMEWLLEHIHVYSGMPWWGSIAATAIVLRLATLPLFIRSSDVQARMAAMVSVTKPIQERMTAAQRSGDNEALLAVMQERMAVNKKAGIKMRATIYPMVMQSIIGFCGFKLLRAMSTLPVPGFRDGGFLWLSDLTSTDPYGLLPVLMGGAMHLLFRLGGESGASSTELMKPGVRNFMLYGMPGIVILIMSWQPGALCVWFATTGAFGMAQALLLQNPKVREYLGIAPLYRPTKAEGAPGGPLQDMIEAYTKPGAKARRERVPVMEMGSGASGRGTPYMQPQWQAPNLHTQASSSSAYNGSGGRVIDVKATSTSSSSPAKRSAASSSSGNPDMIPPPPPIFGSRFKLPGSQLVGDLREWSREKWRAAGEMRQASAEATAKKNKRRMAEAYEKKARERGR